VKNAETSPSGDVTILLRSWRGGDKAALDRLVPLVYDALRRLAAQRLRSAGQAPATLQPTALVHEAFLRLVHGDVDWQSRAHFFAVASTTMRNVAIDHARRRGADKRGGDLLKIELTAGLTPGAAAGEAAPMLDVLALDEALRRLEQLDARQAKVVELRYFAGLSTDETAAVLDCSSATVERAWRTARAWLFRELEGRL
jgi:RNA polymerase sigma factor (TIGR02999 family)